MIDIQEMDITGKETPEEIEAKIEEKLNIKMDDLRQALAAYTKENATTLAVPFTTLVPYGDYGRLLEEQEHIATFLKDDASAPKNWSLSFLEETDTRLVLEPLLEFVFDNMAVDDDELRGFVYVGASGKIKHVFVRSDQ